MSYFIEKQYKKEKKEKKILNFDYIIILNLILGNLTKKGKKSISYFFLINILFFLKKESIKQPFLELNLRLNKIKPSILLYNRRKGTLIFELPRFLSIEQSTKKSIEWLIKLIKKRKKDMLESLLLELKNIEKYTGELWKKKNNILLIAEKNRPFLYFFSLLI